MPAVSGKIKQNMTIPGAVCACEVGTTGSRAQKKTAAAVFYAMHQLSDSSLRMRSSLALTRLARLVAYSG